MGTTIKSQRLELVFGNLEFAQAEVFAKEKIQEILQAEVPDNWPPPLNDLDSAKYFLNFVEGNPDNPEYSAWYIILVEQGIKRAIGNIGFKGLPDESGTIEIGYSIMENHQRKGYASEAVALLVSWAFNQPKVERVIAETLVNGLPSQKVLKNNGFILEGKGSEPGVLRFELVKSNFSKL
jgi:ribosomal-protein-alanine N-acetyltransferase